MQQQGCQLRDSHSKWSKPDRDKLSYSIVYGIWKNKNDKNELIYKTETDSHASKTNLWLPKGKGEGEE